MAHNLEIKNGKASFVTARVPAWHQLGTVLPDSFTAEEALNHGGLANWNIRKAPLYAADEKTGELQPIDGKFGVVRDGGAPLGVVGNTYTIMQNESLTTLLDALVDESGAHYETAGAIDNGKRVFVSMKMPDHISIGGVDPIETYLTAMTAHDGTAATSVMISPVRVVCQNTMSLAMREATAEFRVKHTTSAERIIYGEARQALDMSFKYLDEFQDMAERLINTPMTQGRFEQIIEAEFGAPADSHIRTQTRSQNKIDGIFSLYSDAQTHEDVRNTKWAGLNALVEWADHFQPVRAGGEDEQTARARRTLVDHRFKARALELIEAA